MPQDVTKFQPSVEEFIRSESFALKVLNASLNGFYVYDVKLGKNIFINAQYTRLTGYTLLDLQRMDDTRFFALFHPEDQQRVADHMEKILLNSVDVPEIEYRFKTKDGRWIWCLSRDSVLARNKNGSVSQFIGTFFDITTHKEFEEALLKSEKLYRELAANLPNGAAFVVDHGLRYLLAEGQAISEAGMKSGDLEGKTIWEALDSELALQYEPYYRAALGGKSFQWEHFSHGRHYATYGRPLRDAHGNIYATLAVSYDITERKRSEMALKESETKFRELFETLTQGVAFQIPPDGQIVDCNPAAEKLLGLSRAQMLGRKPNDPAWQIINADASEHNVDENPVILALRTGQIVRDRVLGVYHPLRKRHRWLHVDAIPQFRPGENQPYMACVLFTDITDRKNSEDQVRKINRELENRVKQRTAEIESQYKELKKLNTIIRHLTRKTLEAMESDRRNLAKEIHDSIAGSLAAIKILLEPHCGPSAQGSQSDLMPIEKIVEHLARAIKETRNISWQLRSSTLDDFGLKPALLEHIKHFKEWYPEIEINSEIEINGEIIPEDLQTVLYRVIQEALNNVGKHSAATMAHLKLTEHENQILLEIADNGCGFDPQIVFSDANLLGGYGIHSMRERVEICKGKFEIISEPGAGTTIDVSIPFKFTPAKLQL